MNAGRSFPMPVIIAGYVFLYYTTIIAIYLTVGSIGIQQGNAAK